MTEQAFGAMGIIFTIAMGIILLVGFIADTGKPNTWENLYTSYLGGRNQTLKIKLQMMEEETKQMEEETKQMALTIGDSIGD